MTLTALNDEELSGLELSEIISMDDNSIVSSSASSSSPPPPLLFLSSSPPLFLPF